MSDVRQYSLADHTLTISNNTRSITIGNGSSVESITVTFDNDNFSFTMSADGTAALNKNYMKNGSVSISINQTNPFVNELNAFYNAQMLSGVVDTARMILKDTNGNVNARFEKCVITKIPDYSAGNESASRPFVIIFGKGIFE